MTLIFDSGDAIVAKLNHLELLLMTWQDALNAFKGDVDAMVTRVNTDLTNFGQQVTTLQQQVTDLQNQLNSAEIPADAQATLDAMDQTIKSLDVPAPVEPPTPPPAS